MTAVFVLDVPENEGVVEVAEQDALLQVEKVGPYYRIALDDDGAPEAADPGEDVGAGHTSTRDQIVIDRRATGCRHAVWYSALAGLQQARVAQHDKDALRVVHAPQEAR
ncbi:hypothetical protein H7X46_09390 [Pseudonocardia sp. C8]|uniref:hypothetical protein n=1 Tax=Pseudonocardia sp. C8 TaxID=2762759 RepID=UPI00164256DF|nr:hypothetical protein [Pseudonocardia sp. C8]